MNDLCFPALFLIPGAEKRVDVSVSGLRDRGLDGFERYEFVDIPGMLVRIIISFSRGEQEGKLICLLTGHCHSPAKGIADKTQEVEAVWRVAQQ